MTEPAVAVMPEQALLLPNLDDSPSQGESATAQRRRFAERSQRVARNLVVVLSSQMAVWLIASGLVVIVPRYLGDTSVGKLAFAMALTTIVGTVGQLGVAPYLTREIARDPSAAPHLTWNALVFRIPTLLVGALVVVGFVYVFQYPQSTKNVVFLTMGLMTLYAFQSTLMAAFQGLERMTLVSGATIVEKALNLILGATALVVLGLGLTEYAVTLVAAIAASTAVLLVHFWRAIGFSFRLDLSVWRQLLKGGAPFLVWGVALIIYGQIDLAMLSVLTGDDVVGWYSTAYRFVGIPAFIPAAVMVVLLPSLSNADPDDFRKLARRALDFVMIICLPIALVLIVGARVILEMLYGAEFHNAIILLRILAIHEPLVAISMIAGTALIASNREVAWTRVAVLAAITNPMINGFMIPVFDAAYENGAIGAAIVTLITESFMVISAFWLLDHDTFDRSNVLTAIRALVAGAPMCAAMLIAIYAAPHGPFGSGPVVAMLIAGGLTYVAAAFAVGLVKVADVRQARTMLLARVGGGGAA